MEYSIRDLSKKYGVNSSTLRYYEDCGLLTGVTHLDNGKRTYYDCHIERLDGIMCFKHAGMSIAQIREFYDYEADLAGNIDKITKLISDQEKTMVAEMAELQAALDHIREKIYFYSLVKEAVEKGEEMPLWDQVFREK